jgi:UDP-glucuronate 4-epimerase
VVRALDRIPTPAEKSAGPLDPASSPAAPYRLYNIGNNNPVKLMDFIDCIEAEVGKKAKKNFLPMQAGDVPATSADVSDLIRDVGFQPATPVAVGVKNFVRWYREYFQV